MRRSTDMLTMITRLLGEELERLPDDDFRYEPALDGAVSRFRCQARELFD